MMTVGCIILIDFSRCLGLNTAKHACPKSLTFTCNSFFITPYEAAQNTYKKHRKNYKNRQHENIRRIYILIEQ